MADETIELTEVQEIIGGLSSPTDEEFVQATRDFSDGAIAGAAAQIALAGGGGGGGAAFPFTGDAEVTGTLKIDSAGDADKDPLIASTDYDGDGLGLYVKAVGGDTIVEIDATQIRLHDENFDSVLQVRTASIGFFGTTPQPQPEIPATPSAQDIADVLVALGLATQAA